MTGKTAAATTAVEGELLPFDRIANDFTDRDLRAMGGSRLGICQGIEIVPVRRVPTTVTLPGLRRGRAVDLQRGGLLGEDRGCEQTQRKTKENRFHPLLPLFSSLRQRDMTEA
jgi:hypothetical protein